MSEMQALPEVVDKSPEAPGIYRAIIYGLIVVGVLTVLGGIGLALVDKQLPEAIIVLGSVSVGALAGAVTQQSR